MSAVTRPLPMSIKVGWAIGEVGVAAFIGTTMIFMLYFLTQAIGVSPVLAGLILLIPRIWDAAIDPIIGAVSDRTTTRFGRRRPYVLAGAVTLGPLFALMFFVPAGLTNAGKAIYLTVTYLLASTAYSLFDVPYSAMAAEMTGSYTERTNLVSYKEIAARLGIVASVIVAPLIFTSRQNLADGFRLLGVVGGAFITLTFAATFFLTRSAPRHDITLQPFSVREEFTALAENRPFRTLWLVFLIQNLAIGASATTLVYLITFVMHADAKVVGPLLSISSIIGVFVTPLWAILARRRGKRGGYFLALALVAAMSLPAIFIPPPLYLMLFAVLLLAGVGDAGTQLLPGSMVPDTVEVEEHRTGMRREGAIFGAWIFCRKLGMAGGAFLVSIGLSLFNFSGGAVASQAQPPSALLGIRVIYCLLPFALYLIAMALLTRYDLSEARFNALQADIANTAAERTAI